MDFGKALELLKSGKAVAREGWNGKGQYIYYIPAASYPVQTDIAKAEWGDNENVPYTAYLAIKTVQNTVAPWLASQTDALAEDWKEVDVPVQKQKAVK